MAVQVSEAPGAKVGSGQLSPVRPVCGSVTVMFESVTFPVLVTR